MQILILDNPAKRNVYKQCVFLIRILNKVKQYLNVANRAVIVSACLLSINKLYRLIYNLIGDMENK